MSSAISSCKDPWERISPGSPQDLLLRTCTASCKDLLERNLARSPQEPTYARFKMKIPQAKGLRTPRRFLNFWICLQLMLRCLHVKGFYVMVPDWDLSISEQRVTYQHLGKLEALPAVSYMSQRGHQRRTLAKEFVICVWGGKKRISEQVLNIFHMRTSDLAHVGSKRCIRFCLGNFSIIVWFY